jgi:hypothetical protein
MKKRIISIIITLSMIIGLMGNFMMVAEARYKQESNGNDLKSGVYLYQGENFRGRSIKFSNSKEIRGLGRGFNDTISSIKIIGDYEVTIYEHSSFRGQSHTITKSESSLKSIHIKSKKSRWSSYLGRIRGPLTFDNRISSIKIVAKTEIESAKKAFESLSPEAKSQLEEVISGDEELQKFHKEHIDKNYVAKDHKKISRSFMSPLYQLNRDLIRLNLPTAFRYALLGVGGGLVGAVADGLLPVGEIVALISSAGVVVLLGWYWDDVSHKWNDIVGAFERAFSSIESSIEAAFFEISYEKQLEDAVARVETQIKRFRYPIKFYRAGLNWGKGAYVYYSQGSISVAQAAALVMFNKSTINVYCTDGYIAQVFANAMSFGSGIRPLEGGPNKGEAYHYHTKNVLTKNTHIFKGRANIYPR